MIKNDEMKIINIFLFCVIPTYLVANNSDSLRKNSIGLAIPPLTLIVWKSTGSETLVTVKEDNSKYNNEKTLEGANKIQLFSQNVGCFYNREIVKNLFFGIGLMHARENLYAQLRDTLSNNTYYIKRLNIRIKYIEIPIEIKYTFWDNNKLKRGTNFILGINMDYVFKEEDEYGNIYYYNLDGTPIPYTGGRLMSKDNKYKLNKISPFIYVGREKFNKKRTLSFKYGSMVIFKSFYQKHNTGEYLKNYKISPLIIGFAYHF